MKRALQAKQSEAKQKQTVVLRKTVGRICPSVLCPAVHICSSMPQQSTGGYGANFAT